MIVQTASRLAWVGLLALILISIFSAFATANTVLESGLYDSAQSITANNLKPLECAGLDLANVIDNGSGGPGNDLILGTTGADILSGGDGDDCIVGGDGNDTLAGGNGNDILLGNNGDDNLSGDGGSSDECYGGDGSDTLDASCEIQVE